MNIQAPGIKLEQTSGLLCESCGNNTFREAVMIRKVSRFLSPSASGKDEPLIVPVFTCTKCDQVVTEFLPEALRKPINTDE